jgi:hypothetical protein
MNPDAISQQEQQRQSLETAIVISVAGLRLEKGYTMSQKPEVHPAVGIVFGGILGYLLGLGGVWLSYWIDEKFHPGLPVAVYLFMFGGVVVRAAGEGGWGGVIGMLGGYIVGVLQALHGR